MNNLPVGIIGAGPIGLAAAAHLSKKGEDFAVFEAAESVAANVRKWRHVRMFSPWELNLDSVAVALLEDTGWAAPNYDDIPTGQELIERYLEPLSKHPLIAPKIRFGMRILSVTRNGFDKLKTVGRDEAAFLLRAQNPDGRQQDVKAKAVIDASGTFASPNPLGSAGIPALNEELFAEKIFYGISDILGADKARYANRWVAVVGSGHSAAQALLNLATLAEQEPNTRIVWVVRKPVAHFSLEKNDSDWLSERGRLEREAWRLVSQGCVRLITNFRLSELSGSDDGVVIRGDCDGVCSELPAVEEIIAATGSRPNLEMLRELRLNLDSSLESPAQLASIIDPNIHTCNTVPAHGAEQLSHAEKNLYIVGMKSYGRAPTFLLKTGYEQVRSVVAAITGEKIQPTAQISGCASQKNTCSEKNAKDSLVEITGY